MTGRYWFYLALLGNAEAGRTRDPHKRLARLRNLAITWMETNIVNNSGSVAVSEFREQRGADLINNIKNKTDKMKEVYEATNPETGDKRCGFYDPDVPNGGPQPYEVFVNEKKRSSQADAREVRQFEITPGGTPDLDADGRTRTFEEKFQRVQMTHDEWRYIRHNSELTALQNKILDIERWFRNNGIDDDDVLDITAGGRMRRGAGRISDDPIRGLKQIAKGFKNWSERYIAYCKQEYVNNRFSKEWANDKLWKKTDKLYRCKISGYADADCDN
jgi:hypothetical protein